MTPLRQRMLDSLQLGGLAERTQQAYIDAVARLALHYDSSPDEISSDQIRQYLLHLLRERHLSHSTLNQYGCAYRFLYRCVLQRDDWRIEIPLGRVPQRLPEILSREELARLFGATRSPKAQTFLMLAYGTGLRLSELCNLRVTDIDSHADRMCLRVEQGKGGKDRYVPLSANVLELLRTWWRRAHPRSLLFPGRDEGQPMQRSGPPRWYRAACAAAGITKQGGIHTLRHCYATHLLEVGVDVHTLAQWLGHNHISTTMRYLHLVRPDVPDGARGDPLALLAALPKIDP